MKKIMLVFGTRPEAIKMCPLVKEFQKRTDEFETIVCVTGQEMKDALSDYLNVLFEKSPEAVGGSLPAESFYYIP